MQNVLNKMGKIIKENSDFYFSSYRKILSKIEVMTSQNDTKMTITRKIKIVKTWKLVFPSIQPILDYSCKFEKWILRIWAKKFSIFFLRGHCPPCIPPPNLSAPPPSHPACFWIEERHSNRHAIFRILLKFQNTSDGKKNRAPGAKFFENFLR